MPQPQQQYKLRLGEGTLLLVDRDALNTWLMDDKAMVQQVGTRRWRTLKQFLADEREAAFYAKPAAPTAPPTPGPLPLVYPPPRVPVQEPAPAAVAKAPEPVTPASQESFVPEEMETFDPAFEPTPLNVPLAVTNLPLIPPDEPAPLPIPEPEPELAVSPTPAEPVVAARAARPIAPPPEPEPIVVPPPPEPIEALLAPPPAPEAAPPAPRPAAKAAPKSTPKPEPKPAPHPAQPALKRRAPEPIAKASAPSPVLREADLEVTAENLLSGLQALAAQAPPAPKPLEPPPPPVFVAPDPEPVVERSYEPPPAFSRSPRLQVLADDTDGQAAVSSPADDVRIALKPLDEPESLPGLEEEDEEDAAPAFAAPEHESLAARTGEMVSAWGGLVKGWADSLDRRSHARPTPPRMEPAPTPALVVAAQNAAAGARTMLATWTEMLKGWIARLDQRRTSASAPAPTPVSFRFEPPQPSSVAEPVHDRPVPPPVRPAAAPSAPQVVRLAAAPVAPITLVPPTEPLTARLGRALSEWGSAAGTWLERFRRDRSPRHTSLSLSSEPTTSTPEVRAWIEPIPVPPPVQPPPPILSLPTLRLAEIEPDVETGDVYDGEEGPGVLHVAGLWAKRIVVAAGLVVGSFIAYDTWENWLPKAGRLGVNVVTEIEKRVPNPQAERERQQAVQSASDQLPHLDPQTIQLLMSRHGVIEAVEVFDVAYRAAEQGMPALTPEESAEMARLRAELMGTLTAAEQKLIRDHERVRKITPSADDHTIIELIARAARDLPAESRDRLHALSAKAVTAALAEPPVPEPPVPPTTTSDLAAKAPAAP